MRGTLCISCSEGSYQAGGSYHQLPSMPQIEPEHDYLCRLVQNKSRCTGRQGKCHPATIPKRRYPNELEDFATFVVAYCRGAPTRQCAIIRSFLPPFIYLATTHGASLRSFATRIRGPRLDTTIPRRCIRRYAVDRVTPSASATAATSPSYRARSTDNCRR